MLKNYLVVALRNLLRHKTYSAINIAGLAVGMACCFLMLLLVQDELSYDQHHPYADRTYRVAWESWKGEAMSPAVLAPALKAHFSEVEEVVRFIGWGRPVVGYKEKRFYEDRFRFADPNFFRIFAYVFSKGDPATALVDPNTVVITEAMARKYFGEEDPMGKTLVCDTKVNYRVTGVLKPTSQRSHIAFDFLASSETLKGDVMKLWYMHAAYTYVVLPSRYDPTTLERKFPEFVKQRVDPRAGIVKLFLQPLKDIHLHSHLMNEIEPSADARYLAIFTAVAFLILLVACINFVNLSTARSTHRAREVGTRKVMGAYRMQLARQFLGESVLTCLIALALAVSLVEVLLPGFNALFEKEINVHYMSDWRVLAGYISVALLTGLFSGGYSAFYLSAFEPVRVLKGVSKPGTLSRYLRRGLVVFQFVISIALIVSTIIMYSQLRYIRNKELGFDKDQVVVISMGWSLRGNYESFKHDLLASPHIQSVTAGSPPVSGGYTTYGYTQEDGRELIYLRQDVDYDYLKVLGIPLISGRDFSRDYGTDTSAAVVNEAFARQLGWDFRKSPGEFRRVADKSGPEVRAIGVVKNFHLRPLHEEIRPVIISLKPGVKSWVLVRIRRGDIQETLAFLKRKWEAYVPDRPFEYSFLDEDIDRLYRKEQQQGRIFGTFALLTVAVACLGLFGLVSFMAEQRTKEIGIRKVLGASVLNIVITLSKEFVMLVGVANLIAWPMAYYIMNRWLQDFAYRIELGPGVFVLGGLLALAIALLTVSSQAIKAATANPVDALRYE